MRTAVYGFLMALVPVPLAGQEAELPAWMAGCWEMRDGARWAEECWTAPRAGLMMGSGRTGTGGQTASWEFMRIERGDDGPIFSASPNGEGWTSFASAENSVGRIGFVNPANDYPQRVLYWREGELLAAEISLEDGSRSMRWTFRRMTGG